MDYSRYAFPCRIRGKGWLCLFCQATDKLVIEARGINAAGEVQIKLPARVRNPTSISRVACSPRAFLPAEATVSVRSTPKISCATESARLLQAQSAQDDAHQLHCQYGRGRFYDCLQQDGGATSC